ncbi:NAD-dependent epimerase/dehydratase family protein [Vibrio diazotrophicus]|uniref:NAD-dependent epimerase/dehydratase family protein n=1 Tax=Vibrio diazotrophicus TaxID=685 RepID=UPI000C9DC482|nr:NAD(P)-dependent oxidoreductase [Vibrio diazotrophicus]PNH80585.1 NAD(P)-dependent oxidoreductase [Vibrio diazotrophicus]
MRVLVTGSTGFIGRQFCKYKQDQFEIVALVRDINKVSFENVEVRQFDGSYQSLVDALHGVDAVLHLATTYIAEHKAEDIDQLIDSNLTFGTKILEAMVETKVNKLVNIGTTWQRYNGEEHRYVNLYATTKQAFQEIVNWYSDAKGLSVINLHLNDSYGEEDSRKKLIQLLIERAEDGKPLNMSPGEQRFDACYISDILNGVSIALDMLNKNEQLVNDTYALLTGKDMSLRELVRKIEQLVGKSICVNWGAREYRAREVMEVPFEQYCILPNWVPEIDLDKGIKRMLKKQ